MPKAEYENNTDIVLVICPIWSVYTPPLGLSYLSAALRRIGRKVVCKDFNAELYNSLRITNGLKWEAEVEHDKLVRELVTDDMVNSWAQEVTDNFPRVVGFSVFYSNFLNSIRMAKAVKKIDRRIRIVFGGPQVPLFEGTDLMNELSECVDYLIIGEGENALTELVGKVNEDKKDFKHPSIIDVRNISGFTCGSRSLLLNHSHFINSLDSLAFPDFSDYDLNKYQSPQLPLMLTRGCVARCKFCWETVYWGHFLRCRGPENMLSEVKRNNDIYHVRSYIFSDSAVNNNPSLLRIFADLLVKENLDVNWWGQARIHKSMTPDYLELLRRSGCITLAFGIESVSQKVLDAMGKNYKKEDIQRVIKDTYESGIKININLLVGFPGETEEDLKETEIFITEYGEYLEVVNVTALGLVPNTSVWLNMEGYGIKISPKGWLIPEENNTPEVRMERSDRLTALAKRYIEKTKNLYRVEK